MKLQYSLPLLLLVTSPVVSREPGYVREVSPFPIARFDGNPYTLPFFGGLNRPVQQFVDIDADGDFDIFVGDGGDKVRFFENAGNPEVPDYQ